MFFYFIYYVFLLIFFRLRYDWEQMEAAGGPNWNYDKYIKQQFFNQENYTGNSTSGLGTAGEINILIFHLSSFYFIYILFDFCSRIIDSVFVPSAVNAVPISAAQQLYPSFTQSEGLDSNVSTGSVSTFQLTMKNYGGGKYPHCFPLFFYIIFLFSALANSLTLMIYIRESSSTAHLNKNIITVEVYSSSSSLLLPPPLSHPHPHPLSFSSLFT